MNVKDISVNAIIVQNLYEMRTYTDQQAGTIFRQIPILEDGQRDPMRQEAFGGGCQLLINGRSMPLNFPIEDATSLRDAIEKFPDAVRAAIQKMHDEALRTQLATGNMHHSVIDLSKTKN